MGMASAFGSKRISAPSTAMQARRARRARPKLSRVGSSSCAGPPRAPRRLLMLRWFSYRAGVLVELPGLEDVGEPGFVAFHGDDLVETPRPDGVADVIWYAAGRCGRFGG